MRTIFVTLLLLLTLTACGGKEDVPTDPAGETPSAEKTEAQAENADQDVSAITADTVIDPIGDLRMADGTVIELTRFEKIGKYYIYISGKLNGRSSTVISFTRLDDLKRFASINFKDPHTFTIVTKGEKELPFTDSHVYIGSDKSDTYTFYTTDPNTYKTTKIDVKKQDVKSININ